MVLVTRERKDMIDRQLERNIVRQEEARRKREFDRQAHNSTPYPVRRSKVDVCAVLSARNREMRDDTRALDHLTAAVQGVRVADEVDRAVVPAPASNAVVPAPPPLVNQLGEAGIRVPAQRRFWPLVLAPPRRPTSLLSPLLTHRTWSPLPTIPPTSTACPTKSSSAIWTARVERRIIKWRTCGWAEEIAPCGDLEGVCNGHIILFEPPTYFCEP
jgi:hypothetical protein